MQVLNGVNEYRRKEMSTGFVFASAVSSVASQHISFLIIG